MPLLACLLPTLALSLAPQDAAQANGSGPMPLWVTGDLVTVAVLLPGGTESDGSTLVHVDVPPEVWATGAALSRPRR